MKSRKILSVAAAVALMTAIIPTAATAAASPATAQIVQITMIKALCPGYTVVPANKNPANFDQTGGHSAELDTSYQTVLTNPATDIPGICRRADGWQFQLYGDPGLSTTVGSPLTTGADGVGSGSVTVTLDPTELALAQTTGAPTGLWIAGIGQPGVASFGAMRCYNDIHNGDNAENIQGIGTASLHIYCIAYDVLPGATYHALTPYRVLDSRSSKGGTTFHSHSKQTVLIATGTSGVPTTALAVTGNVTVVGQTAGGFVTVAPSLTSGVEPLTSTLNFPRADTRANGVTVPLAAGGSLDFMFWASSAGSTANVLFDVTGYFSADASGATYYTIAPYRVLDTRSSKGGTNFHSQVKQTVLIATGTSGVPATALAVTGNVTVVGQTAGGFVTVAPSLTSGVQPGTSTLNLPTGDVRANNVTVQLAAGGNLDFMYWVGITGPTADVLFDVTGYFTNDALGASYHALSPYRVLDSRVSKGGTPFHSHASQTVLTATSASRLPTTAVALTGNVTVVGQTAPGFVSVAPSLMSGVEPSTSTINFPYGDVRANGVTVPLAAGGNLDFMYWVSSTGPTTNVLLDITGYFAP